MEGHYQRKVTQESKMSQSAFFTQNVIVSSEDGDEFAVRVHLRSVLHPQQRKFDLVLGSDLVYDKDVVTPIMDSVSALMADGGIFLLSQSFLYDDATEMLIDQLCAQHGFERIVLKDDLTSEGGFKLQEFHWKMESSSC